MNNGRIKVINTVSYRKLDKTVDKCGFSVDNRGVGVDSVCIDTGENTQKPGKKNVAGDGIAQNRDRLSNP